MSPQASHSSHQTDTRRAALRRASLRAILLATSALAIAALPATVARAADGDATWLGTQPDDGDKGNFNNVLHWDSVIPTGTATFNASDTRAITFNDFTTLGGIAVTSGAGGYTFDTNGFDITFNGAGLSVGSGASLTFTNSGGSFTFFEGSSTAGQATINVNSGRVFFDEQSNAGQAKINVSSIGELDFETNSSAGSATIVSDGRVAFFNAATGGTARITLNGGGVLDISALDGTLVHPDGTPVTGVTLGSIEGGSNSTIFLGGFNLTVGGDGRTTTFARRHLRRNPRAR